MRDFIKNKLISIIQGIELNWIESLYLKLVRNNKIT